MAEQVIWGACPVQRLHGWSSLRCLCGGRFRENSSRTLQSSDGSEQMDVSYCTAAAQNRTTDATDARPTLIDFRTLLQHVHLPAINAQHWLLNMLNGLRHFGLKI